MLHSVLMKMNHIKVWWIGIFALLVVVLALPPMSRAEEEVSPLVLEDQPVQILVADEERVQFVVVPPEMERELVGLDGNIYDRLIMEGYAQSRVAGQPGLPEKSFVVALPPGAVPVVSVVELTQVHISGVMVAPVTVQELVGFDGDLSVEVPEFVERVDFDPVVYEMDQMFPAAAATLGDVFWLRDQRAVPVVVHPVQVNPVAEKGVVNTRLVVEVRFTYPDGRPENSTPRAESAVYEQILHQSLLNYEPAINWREVHVTAAAPQTSPACLIGTPIPSVFRWKTAGFTR